MQPIGTMVGCTSKLVKPPMFIDIYLTLLLPLTAVSYSMPYSPFYYGTFHPPAIAIRTEVPLTALGGLALATGIGTVIAGHAIYRDAVDRHMAPLTFSVRAANDSFMEMCARHYINSDTLTQYKPLSYQSLHDLHAWLTEFIADCSALLNRWPSTMALLLHPNKLNFDCRKKLLQDLTQRATALRGSLQYISAR